MIDSDRQTQARREIRVSLLLCVCAVLPPLLSWPGGLRLPIAHADTPGLWFDRSGAMMTVFAIFAQFRVGELSTIIAGGTFAESWDLYRKYTGWRTALWRASTALAVVGTLIWGYGDLLFT